VNLFIAFVSSVPEGSDARKTEWLKSTAQRFGGYSLSQVKGGWLAPSGILVEEPSTRLELLTTASWSDVEDWARETAQTFGQECVLLVRVGGLRFSLVTSSPSQASLLGKDEKEFETSILNSTERS
jgi:hypothetical protein